MNIFPGNAQHIGKRQEQQDSFAFSNLGDRKLTARIGALVIVADGMGGLDNGSQASGKAVQVFLSEYEKKKATEPVTEALLRSLIVANNAVLSMCEVNETGSTLVAAVISRNELYWISVGDSRIYLVREGTATRLNVDHNFGRELNQQLLAGVIGRKEAREHPERGHLTSYVGKQELTEIDRNVKPLSLKEGDRILLCSDGLHGSLSESEIARLASGDPHAACERLVNEVARLDRPQQDNVTAAMLAYGRTAEPITVKRHAIRRKFRPKTLIYCLLAAFVVLLGVATAIQFLPVLKKAVARFYPYGKAAVIPSAPIRPGAVKQKKIDSETQLPPDGKETPHPVHSGHLPEQEAPSKIQLVPVEPETKKPSAQSQAVPSLDGGQSPVLPSNMAERGGQKPASTAKTGNQKEYPAKAAQTPLTASRPGEKK